LFGGVNGLLEKMKNDKIKPTIKTITFLMELAPDSLAAENEIIKYARSENIKLDIDFFNMLIKKRSLRGAKKEAKQVLDDIHMADLRPNIVTYGVLALSCSTPFESRDIMQTMKMTGHTVNKFVLDAMLNNAFLKKDFRFVLELMEIVIKERVRLDNSTFEKLDQFQQKMTEIVKRKDPISRKENFKVGFAKFNLRYKTWQRDVERRVITERVSKTK